MYARNVVDYICKITHIKQFTIFYFSSIIIVAFQSIPLKNGYIQSTLGLQKRFMRRHIILNVSYCNLF